MRLTVINGSPRGKRSNTAILMDAFLKGFMKKEGNQYEIFYLNKKYDEPSLQKNFLHSEAIIVAFPLYTDAMPGIVKEYFELLEPYKRVNPGLKLGYVVQSGFPESYHSFFVARYLKKITGYFEAQYLGTIIKGGIEGIQIKPHWMKRSVLKKFENLGYKFALREEFDRKLIEKLAKPVHLSPFTLGAYRLMNLLGMSNYYWDMQLKKNKAFENRWEKPYL